MKFTEDELISLEEAAKYLKMERDTLRKKCLAKKIEHYNDGGKKTFRKYMLDDYLESKKVAVEYRPKKNVRAVA